jgi:AraC-like DNA-binding protein
MNEQAAAARYSILQVNGFDPDALAEVITDTRIEQRILRGGAFSVTHHRVNWRDVILECGEYSLPVLAQGCLPGDRLCIGFTLDAREIGSLNGEPVLPGSPRIFTEGCEVNYRTAAGLTWTTLHVSRQELEDMAVIRLGRPLPIPARGLLNLLPSDAGRALARTIRETLSTASRVSALPAAFAREPRDRLLDAYIDAIAGSLQLEEPPLSHAAIRRTEVVSRAREHLLENLRQPFSMQALCMATARTERVLQYTFREVYGLGPKAWFQVMKLNAIHRDLRSIGPGDARITDLAMRWGFLHLGRFSMAYRRLFGERPIDTLKGGSTVKRPLHPVLDGQPTYHRAVR